MTDSHLEKTRPDGCRCDPAEWSVEISPICPDYLPEADDDARCLSCQHDRGCHLSALARQLFSIGEAYAKICRGDLSK